MVLEARHFLMYPVFVDTRTGISSELAMEFTESRYCKTSRMLLMFLGQWPYQKSSDRKIRMFCTTTAASLLLFTQAKDFIESCLTRTTFQFMKFVRSYRELDMFEVIPPTITTLVCIIKLHSLIMSKKKLEFLQKQINEDWNKRTESEEIKIMEEYAMQGEIYSVAYMYIMFITLAIYIIFIFQPYILDIVSPLNETRPFKLLYPAEFFIDEEKYFLLIAIISITNCVFVIIILVAFDTMLITYVQYICGMLSWFKIIGNTRHVRKCIHRTSHPRLKYTIDNTIKITFFSSTYIFSSSLREKIKLILCWTLNLIILFAIHVLCKSKQILRHQKMNYTRYRLEYKLYNGDENQVSINSRLKKYQLFIVDCVSCYYNDGEIDISSQSLINLLDSTFMLCQLIVLGLNMLCLSITLVRTAVLVGSIEMCRYMLYAFGQLLHVLYVSYQSERLIDHTLSISNRIYCGKWYTIPKQFQKMLLFISRRSTISSYLTAGKIFIYSMQNFSMVTFEFVTTP
ncbi:uncharacterized protein LOC143147438 [Ptiloglossa arizonensis]|uniref:uncharacterized protein LOC143147438 n=1 Tax=Ptiloglossa arizonensis TaxID=3350558 RepID=UPI003FA17ACD